MEVLISGILISAGFLIILSGIAIFLYRIPIRISFAGSRREGNRDLHACVGWGLVDLCIIPRGSEWQGEVRIRDVSLFRKNIRNETPDTGSPPETGKVTEPPSPDLLRYIPLISRIIPELIHYIRIGNLTGDIRFGAGDPVTTGLVYGYYHAIRPLISGRICSFDMVPDFNLLILEGEVKAGVLITRPFGLVVRVTAIILPVVIRDLLPSGGDARKRAVHA